MDLLTPDNTPAKDSRFRCDCCNVEAPGFKEGDTASQYSINREGTRTLCRPCSYKEELRNLSADFKAGKPYGCYLSSDGEDGASVTDWIGNRLGEITVTHAISHPWQRKRGGMLAVSFTDKEGNRWHGRGQRGMYLTLYPSRVKVCTVTLEVTDLWNTPEGWTGNYCWKREYTASAPTRKGAIRKALAMTEYKGWRLNYWASNTESWKLDGACIGAYIVERF